MIPFESEIVFSSVFSIDMDMSLYSKKQEYLYFERFSVFSFIYFTRTSHKPLSLKLLDLQWNLLKRLKEKVKGHAQFVQKVTFEHLMDFKKNHYESWKYYKSC